MAPRPSRKPAPRKALGKARSAKVAHKSTKPRSAAAVKTLAAIAPASRDGRFSAFQIADQVVANIRSVTQPTPHASTNALHAVVDAQAAIYDTFVRFTPMATLLQGQVMLAGMMLDAVRAQTKFGGAGKSQ